MSIRFLIVFASVSLLAISTQAQAQSVFPTDGNNAGIGTTTPAEKLEIKANVPSWLKFTNTNDVLTPVGGLKFNLAGTDVGRIELERTVGGGRLSAFKFFVLNSTSSSGMTEVLRLGDDGNVKVTNRLTTGGRTGIGITSPNGMLHVHAASTEPRQALFTYGSVSPTEGYLEIHNATGSSGMYIPYIKGRAYYPGHTFGLYMVGEAQDVASPENFEAAVILDGRTNTGTRIYNANVLAINSMGINLAVVKADGSLGIGTPVTHGHKLAVAGSGLFTKVVVKQQSAWPDFVFEPEYKLQPLSELAQFIAQNKHLPEMPTAEEVDRDGQDLGEVNRKLLQKVEELTLYIIEQDKARKSVESRLQELEKKLEKIK